MADKGCLPCLSITHPSPGDVPATVNMAGVLTGVADSMATAARQSPASSNALRSRCIGGIPRDRQAAGRDAAQSAAVPSSGTRHAARRPAALPGSGGWLMAAANLPGATPVAHPEKPGHPMFTHSARCPPGEAADGRRMRRQESGHAIRRA